MNDPIVACFVKDFDRFFDLLEQQIEVCPDELWNKKAGGYPFWQQLFHTFACIELFAAPEGAESVQIFYPREVVMLSEFPEKAMSKQELLNFAQATKKIAHTFFNSMTTAKLAEPHVKMSKLLGKDCINQDAAMSLIRHSCYHLGCCDAILRENGIKGVY